MDYQLKLLGLKRFISQRLLKQTEQLTHIFYTLQVLRVLIQFIKYAELKLLLLLPTGQKLFKQSIKLSDPAICFSTALKNGSTVTSQLISSDEQVIVDVTMLILI